MIWFLWIIPCAIANRIRGGWLAARIKKAIPFWATNPSRLFFSGVLSLPLFFTQNLKTSLIFFILFFAGLLFKWSPWQYMMEPDKDIYCLTLRGLVLTAPAGFATGFYWFGFSGTLMGVIYWIAYQLPFKHTESNGYEWVGSDWGELILGGVLGLFVIFGIYYS